MTCIVGMVSNDKVYIGADNIGSNNSQIQSRQDSKVFIKKDMVFGFTTSYRMGQLIKYQLIIPHRIDKSVEEYMYTDFIESVSKLFETKNYSEISNNVQTGGTFIVGYQGKIFIVESDFQIVQPSDCYCSVGSGSSFALGSLYANDSSVNKLATTKIIEALECAEYFNPFVRKPFEILSV